VVHVGIAETLCKCPWKKLVDSLYRVPYSLNRAALVAMYQEPCATVESTPLATYSNRISGKFPVSS
jgi:hypothetical protein